MAKPVILTVDDDPDVLRAMERDLRRQYSARYVCCARTPGMSALDLLRRLKQRNEAVALLLVDHRMPQMNGIETLAEAMKLYPDAKRVLLTAYADTEAAIQGDQRGAASSISAEALGSAGAATLSGAGRFAGRLVRRLPAAF